IGDDETHALQIALDGGGVGERVQHVGAGRQQYVESTLLDELRDGAHVARYPAAGGPTVRRGEIGEMVARRKRTMTRAGSSPRDPELAGERGHGPDGPSRLPPVTILVHAGATHHHHRRP